MERLELSRPKSLEPKPSAVTNFATSVKLIRFDSLIKYILADFTKNLNL